MLSEIAVPIDGTANTRAEISAAIRIAARHSCPVVGWVLKAPHKAPAVVARTLYSDLEMEVDNLPSGHSPMATEDLRSLFIEEAERQGVTAKVPAQRLSSPDHFYTLSSGSDLAVISSDTLGFWKTVKSSCYAKGEFSDYPKTPLLITAPRSSADFHRVVFAYDGSQQAAAAFKAFGKLHTGSSDFELKVLVCTDCQEDADELVSQAAVIVESEKLLANQVITRLDVITAVIDEEFGSGIDLVVSGLCAHKHLHRPRFGHFPEHLIDTKSVSLLVAC